MIIGILIIHSCAKDNDDKMKCSISGSVIGYNPDKCGCCPGWLITNGDDTLKFLTVPDNELLWDLVNFYGYPIAIQFNYKDDNSSCADYYKTMTCVEFDLDLNCSKTGEIIDYNGTECMCCPGWIIKTGKDTIKVLNLPIKSQVRNIVETSGFPIPVKLDYENISGTCKDFYKKVTCIKINN
ncbi:MAG: hypothetical protein GX128_01710 [Bacteroidales bacterium]|nr:hypothetical protein [Bacteroidales bacterium]